MQELLSLLADGKKHSYQELTALLNLGQQELEQKINKLASHIHLHQTADYLHWKPQCPLLNKNRLINELKPYQLFLIPVIDSTNQYLLNEIAHLQQGDICIAEYQSAGRGRRGREWKSPFAGQIILSFYWQLPMKSSLNGLSLVIGLAIAQTLSEMGIQEVNLKWPNDVLLKGKKLAGILVEIANKNNELQNLIIGLGINISMPEQTQINQAWADLQDYPHINREEIIIKLIHNLYSNLRLFQQHGIAFFHQQWLNYDYFLGKEVNVITEQNTISGIAQGIDYEGFLLLTNSQNELMRFNGGEVSLRMK